MDKEYALVRDDSCHWYIVPADKAQEADELLHSPDTDEEPEYAIRIDGYDYKALKDAGFIITPTTTIKDEATNEFR